MKNRLGITPQVAIAGLVVIVALGADAGFAFATVHDSASCVELVRAAVSKEVAANSSPAKHLFRDRKQTPQGSQTRLYVETLDAMAAMTIAYNDRPLSVQDLQGEEGRLAGLAGNAEQLRRKH